MAYTSAGTGYGARNLTRLGSRAQLREVNRISVEAAPVRGPLSRTGITWTSTESHSESRRLTTFLVAGRLRR